MNEILNNRSKNIATPPRLSNWLSTLLVFSVFGIFCDAFISNLVRYWQSCNKVFPDFDFISLAGLTITSAYSSTVADFSSYFVWPSYHLGGVAAVFTGIKYGKPSFVFVIFTWIVVTVAFYMFASGFEVLIVMKVFTLPSSPIATCLILPLCWFISRLFWN